MVFSFALGYTPTIATRVGPAHHPVRMMRDGRAKAGTGASSLVRSAVLDKISRHPART